MEAALGSVVLSLRVAEEVSDAREYPWTRELKQQHGTKKKRKMKLKKKKDQLLIEQLLVQNNLVNELNMWKKIQHEIDIVTNNCSTGNCKFWREIEAGINFFAVALIHCVLFREPRAPCRNTHCEGSWWTSLTMPMMSSWHTWRR